MNKRAVVYVVTGIFLLAAAAGFHPRDPNAPNPEESVPEERRALYRDLKRWRNERAKADGKPAYAIARNAQLAEIVNRAPKSLAELKEVAGIGEAFCRDYGKDVLERVGEPKESNDSRKSTESVQSNLSKTE